MTSAEEFNCILCKEKFDNKDDLQIHFRKHGDPKFNESIKSKSRNQNETPLANEKSNDASEMVNCDVCDEVFPTISKAITHKHKVHPEHDAKYFCPWCGKLFTMKHLYNKHLHTNHDTTEEVPENNDDHFHCDSCNVYFYIPAAMVYHNKFFHRQDTDLPIIGHSKKQKLLNQDLLPVYYCSFCGEEYINKINLHKHICDDHGDENQRPTDVLRCPLCEAIFYHLDAYELHLTFHSSEDVYIETNEMNENELTEYSLETVPPAMERIEDLNNLPDVESSVNTMGIESFLQMAMDEPKDTHQLPEKKSKKHKKHKKSKKPAITLDEFLSMNQDVFGEDLDFQGIEEVPTKVITKQLKVKKPVVHKKSAKFVSSADLQKLQKQGIVVKMQSGNKPSLSQLKPAGKPVKMNQQIKQNVSQTKTQSISASNEVLSKLLNQSSNQLKIIKKSVVEQTQNVEQEPTELKSENFKDETPTEKTVLESMETNNGEKEENSETQNHNVTPLHSPRRSPLNDMEKADFNEDPSTSVTEENDVIGNKHHDNMSFSESNNAHIKQIKTQSINVDLNISPGNDMNNTLLNIGKQITIKSITQPGTKSRVEEKPGKPDEPEINESDIEDDQIPSNVAHAEQNDENLKNKSLESLKNLNSAITIKPLKNNIPGPNKNTTTSNEKTEKINKQNTLTYPESSPVQRMKLESSPETVINKCESPKEKPVHIAASSQVLKNISKNITIKSLSPTVKQSNEDFGNEENNDSDFESYDDGNPQENKKKSATSSISDKLKTISPSQKLSSEISIKSTIQSPSSIRMGGNIEDKVPDDGISAKDEVKDISNNLLKHLKNITAKPVSASKNVYQEATVKSNNKAANVTSQNDVIKKSMKTKEISEDIEIYNIDDSDDEMEHAKTDNSIPIHVKLEPAKPELNSHPAFNVIKNISKNITIKPSYNQTVLKEINSDDEMEHAKIDKTTTRVKLEPTKPEQNSHPALNVIKNISKNINIKSSNNQTVLKEIMKNNPSIAEPFSDEDEIHYDEEYDSNDDFEHHASTFTRKSLPTPQVIKNKNESVKNVLKHLGKNITVKSGNASPTQFIKSLDYTSQNLGSANDTDSDEEFYNSKVKITEVTNEDDVDIDHTNNDENAGIVTQSPEDSNSGDEQFQRGVEKNNECENKNMKIRLNPTCNPTSESLLKNISKNITIKSLSERTIDNEEKTSNTVEPENELIANQAKLCKDLQIKHIKQNKSEIPNDSEKAKTANLPHNKRMEGSSAGPSGTRLGKPGVLNTVNKEVKVKTFQSETVIEEITTTVTKTIRRVNQTVSQQVLNANQTSSSPRMIKPNAGLRMTNIKSNNLQGVTVRHASPAGPVRPKIRQAVPFRPVAGTVVRPSNQLVPIRPNVTQIRPNNSPRMQIKNMPRQQRPVGRPIKISPNVLNQTLKRPGNNDEQTGHFSCFKKPKESLIPGNETNMQSGSDYKYASSSQMSKFSSTTQMVKGNAVTTTQMKSESLSQKQQINRLGNVSGLKIAKTIQVSQVEKTEVNASKRTALEAIEKLQKQGLLVKKPRVEEDCDLPNSDGEDADQFDDDDYDE